MDFDTELFIRAGIDVHNNEPLIRSELVGWHSQCAWHAYDASGEVVDGGQAVTIIEETTEPDGHYFKQVVFVRPVVD